MGIFKAILGICETKKLNDELWQLDGDTVTIKLSQAPELAQESGAVYLKGDCLKDPVLVFKNSDGEYIALKNKCTHKGRKIDPVSGANKLKCCSINHSTFDNKGNVLSGPAEGPLTIYEVTRDGENLVIKLTS